MERLHCRLECVLALVTESHVSVARTEGSSSSEAVLLRRRGGRVLGAVSGRPGEGGVRRLRGVLWSGGGGARRAVRTRGTKRRRPGLKR
ncbi:hypothetical protein chiPu_0003689 [Chiloscyllium punctatum]|uniref:Uncharacterized protein n=1 Tax=Chiloscyllium punctatum TaxID=137246 RepID=A0A401S4F0_CHIPU|nr:hypothetical protein [Chiloscyllium punctatum]